MKAGDLRIEGALLRQRGFMRRAQRRLRRLAGRDCSSAPGRSGRSSAGEWNRVHQSAAMSRAIGEALGLAAGDIRRGGGGGERRGRIALTVGAAGFLKSGPTAQPASSRSTPGIASKDSALGRKTHCGRYFCFGSAIMRFSRYLVGLPGGESSTRPIRFLLEKCRSRARLGLRRGDQRRGGARLCQAKAVVRETRADGTAVKTARVKARAGVQGTTEAEGVTKAPACINSWQRRALVHGPLAA